MDGQRNSEKRPSRTISRRRFVQGLVAGVVIAGLDLWRRPTVVGIWEQRNRKPA